MPKKTLKIVILGDSGVGKTSLMNRYATGKFTGQFKATIGADCVSREVIVTRENQTNVPVMLQLWDTAGQERFQSLGVAFYRGSDAAILVYDVTDANSLDHLAHWKHEFMLQQSTVNMPILVLGNKVDKKPRGVPTHIAEEWCRRNGIQGYLETSAKTAVNVEDAFVMLARAALTHHELYAPQPLFIPPPPSVDLRQQYSADKNDACC